MYNYRLLVFDFGEYSLRELLDEGTLIAVFADFYYVNEIDYEFYGGRILPFPGRILREGIEGNDVRVLQEYLNFISNSYPSIPKVNVDGVFGPSTARQVAAFKQLFNLPGTEDRVNAIVWNSIANVYDDLFNGANVSQGQYPGYDIG